MAGRTLTQHAVPTTFGLVAAGWLDGLVDAAADLARLSFPVQVGGAAGTLAGLVELAGPARARACVDTLAGELGLRAAAPWHGVRRPLTRVADALVSLTDTWGALAQDVLVLGRPEIAELSEGAAGAGGSSTMPGKANPVRSTLLRRAALDAPHRAAALHLAVAERADQRPAGAWQAEWAPLRDLARHSVAAAGHAADLLEGLVVHEERMAARAHDVAATLTAEQRALRAVADDTPTADRPAPADPAAYLGLAGELVDAVLARTSPPEAP